MYTDSLLSEKYGTRILCFDNKCEDKHRQSQNNDPDERQHYIDQPLKKVLAADRIVVLEDGCVAGIGRHAELLESCAVYRDIVASQMKGGVTHG